LRQSERHDHWLGPWQGSDFPSLQSLPVRLEGTPGKPLTSTLLRIKRNNVIDFPLRRRSRATRRERRGGSACGCCDPERGALSESSCGPRHGEGRTLWRSQAPEPTPPAWVVNLDRALSFAPDHEHSSPPTPYLSPRRVLIPRAVSSAAIALSGVCPPYRKSAKSLSTGNGAAESPSSCFADL
jgi:hypothetical protein